MSDIIHEPELTSARPNNDTPEIPTVEQTPPPEHVRWHAEAGRKGAQRIHQLIQEGKLYEKEHGLKRGRQRLRQLIELGKVYEQEHGLTAGQHRRGVRGARQNGEQQLQTLLQALLRIVKPSVRARLAQLIQEPSELANPADGQPCA